MTFMTGGTKFLYRKEMNYEVVLSGRTLCFQLFVRVRRFVNSTYCSILNFAPHADLLAMCLHHRIGEG